MKIDYKVEAEPDSTHIIMHVAYDRISFEHPWSSNVATASLEIEETPANKALCNDLMDHRRKKDTEGLPKYYVDSELDLAERDGWEEGDDE